MNNIFFVLLIIPVLLFSEPSVNITDFNSLHLTEISTNITNITNNEVTNNLEDQLFDAISNNNLEIAIKLLETVDVNTRNHLYQTPLMNTGDQTIEIAKMLLEKSTYINTKDNEGNTALILASKNGQLKLVNLLLSHPDIAINSKNKYFYSAFHYALMNGHTEIVKALINKQADILDPLPNQTLPVIEATKKGYTMILSYLIDKGLSPNTTIAKTKTSLLSIASAYGNLSTIQLLLNKGADPNLPNNLGVTPIFISIGKKYHQITELLLIHGAKTTVKTKDNITLDNIIQTDDKVTKKLLKKHSKK